jgi:hypothetical protein
MEPRIKKTYICRNVENYEILTDIPGNYSPQVGDVGIFEIISIGKHRNIQGDTKRSITLVATDRIMAAFGTRYATAQFEGYVPEHVNQELHILGGGGTVGVVASAHNKFENVGPTKLRMIGLAIDRRGKVINTKKIMQRKMIAFTGAAASVTKVILSLGSSMDSGKTTTAAYLVHGLKKAGMNVAFIKLTGTAYTKDADLGYDMGADVVADFSDFGFPSTYMCEEAELLDLYESLLAKVLPQNPDYVVMEIADGLYERETKMLLNNRKFISSVEDVIFSAGDSLAAINGVDLLKRWSIYPKALCGLFTASPLLIKEVAENTEVPIFTINDMAYGRATEIFVRTPALASN